MTESKKEFICTRAEIRSTYACVEEKWEDGEGKEIVEPGCFVVCIGWGSNVGFGEMHIKRYNDGRTVIDTESMSRDCCKKILAKLVDDAKTEWEVEEEGKAKESGNQP